MDPGLLECCTGPTEDDLISHLSGALRETLGTEYRGDTISARLLEIEARQREDALRKQLKDLEAKVRGMWLVYSIFNQWNFFRKWHLRDDKKKRKQLKERRHSRD